MASGVTIRIEGLDKVLKGMKDYSDQKKKAVDQIFKEGADKIRNKALRAVPVDEGQLKSAIHVNRVKEGYEVVVNNQYAPFVEFGTKEKTRVDAEFASYAAQFKGQQTSGGNMYQNILEWVRRKKVRFAARDSQIGGKRKKRKQYLTEEQTAFIIMKSILVHGIEAKPYLLPSFVAVRKEMIDQIIKELRA